MIKILLLGQSSFAANGLFDLLNKNEFDVDCFSRGEDSRDNHQIRGDVFNLSENPYLASNYDIVINFILIKDESVESNLEFIKEVDSLCRKKNVKRLIQISSISCYPANTDFIDEGCDIEQNPELKGHYGKIKVAADRFLTGHDTPYHISFIRPGFIYTDDPISNIGGIGLKILPKTAILLGNNNTPLTRIHRDRLHQGILRVVQDKDPAGTYLMFENNKSTKRDFLKKKGFSLIIPLHGKLILFAAQLFRKAGVFKASHMEQIKSLFRQTNFNCYRSEHKINYSFLPKTHCIIGAGTFGSYIADRIRESDIDASITIIDVGNKVIKNEEEIGYKTHITKDPYMGTSQGRFFGLGGTSTKWGGQLLTFSGNDFVAPEGFVKDVVEVNVTHREKIFNKFGIKTSFPERELRKGLFIKTGYWLGYFRRNLFKTFKVNKINNLTIHTSMRVVRMLKEQNHITGIEYLHSGRKNVARFDNYYLCAGAFESIRLLMVSGFIDKQSVNFSDHLSQKAFLIKGPTRIGNEDYAFRVKGSSLITKRIVGEKNGVSFYFNPNYNDNFPFFQNLKALLFKKEFNFGLVKNIILDLPAFVSFVSAIIIKRRINVYKNEWEFKIDIENPVKSSRVIVSKDIDDFNEKGIDVEFVIDEEVKKLYDELRLTLKQYLDENGVNYEPISDVIHASKVEDTYHPYGMLEGINSINEYYNWFSNMLVVNTGILPRAGGINTVGAVFPIIEEYFARRNKANLK